jgi:malonate decarboxylase delta subunit
VILMEKLEYRLQASTCPTTNRSALCGVVGSGNLEILVRPGKETGICHITVNTSARGFGTIWQAVLEEFAEHNPAGATRIVINDMGATPAVVSLRLGQALSEYMGDAQ